MLSSIFLWANSEVLWRIVSSFHYYVGSMFSCSRWTIPTGISSPLQRKHPWEKRLGTDVWNPLTSALSAGHLPSLLLWFTNRTTAYIETELAPHCEQGVTPASQLEHHTAESQQGRTGHGTPVQACVTVTHRPSYTSFLPGGVRDILSGGSRHSTRILQTLGAIQTKIKLLKALKFIWPEITPLKQFSQTSQVLTSPVAEYQTQEKE